MRFTLALDAGHGQGGLGEASGHGIDGNAYNLAISKFLGEEIRKWGADLDIHIVYTRPDVDNVSFRVRNQTAEEAGSDLLVSLHCNSTTYHKTRGGRILYKDRELKPLADELLSGLPYSFRIRSTSEIVTAETYPRALYLLNQYTMPSVLWEIGFVSNANDAAIMQDKLFQMGMALALKQMVVRAMQYKQMEVSNAVN